MANQLLCIIDGCDKIQHTKAGLCSRHYDRNRRHGDPMAGGAEKSPAKGVTCMHDGCEKEAVTKRLCCAHYNRLARHGHSGAGRTTNGDPARFIADVAVRFSGDGCLRWPFGTSGDGRARIMVSGKPMYVARIVCELAHGAPENPNLEAAHSCGKGHEGCVSPRHLSWKTKVENEADKLLHGTGNRGERCGTSKLREADVREIRKSQRPLDELAEKFDVDRATIYKVRQRKTWAWMP